MRARESGTLKYASPVTHGLFGQFGLRVTRVTRVRESAVNASPMARVAGDGR